YDKRVLEITSVPAGGPAIGETAGVDNAGFDETDALTLSPALTATPKSGGTYNLYPEKITPELLNAGVNRVLRNTHVPHIFAPSLVNDADFENADISTDWPDVSTPSTKTFTATASTPSNLFLGERSLRLLADSVGDGVESLSFHVTEREQLMIVCFVRADVDAVTVSLRNQTAGSDVERTVTINEELFTEARLVLAVETGMEEARIRFIGTTTTSDFYISPPVIVQTMSYRTYPCPSWLVDPKNQVREAWYLPAGFPSEAADSYVALSQAARTAPMPTFLRSERWLTPLRVELRADPLGPVVLACMRPLAELSSDTATSPIVTHVRKSPVFVPSRLPAPTTAAAARPPPPRITPPIKRRRVTRPRQKFFQ
ncbi:hypothetical protein LCGC14_2334650, partial [marine sediment metagenome]